MKVDPAWAHRRLLLRAGDQLGPKGHDPVEGRLRHRRTDKRDQRGLGRQGDAASDTAGAWPEPVRPARDLDSADSVRAGLRGRRHAEATRLAGTIEKWWPEIEGFLQLGNTNTNTWPEGYNRVIKQSKRVPCGFCNQDNNERRIMLHSAAHRAA